jgi:RimJ/RimL family protein N-acetyltransferase
MLGPRLVGRNGVELRPPTLEDQYKRIEWVAQPEPTRFWAPRFGEWTKEKAEERFKRDVEGRNGISWSIAYHGETVGGTGIFDIDWIRRDGESGLFIGRHDLYGRGIASEAVRLRTRFAWSHLRLHRVHNWIALQNRGSRRANERAGYTRIGLFEKWEYRSGAWIDDWMGEVFPEQAFSRLSDPDTLAAPEEGGA